MDIGYTLREKGIKIDDLQKQIDNREIISKKLRKPLMTFSDDNGSELFPQKWKDIIISKGIPVTCAVSTNNISAPYMTWYEIAQMQEIGVEVISHGHNHTDYTTLSDAAIIADVEAAQALLKEHNCAYDIHAYIDAYDDNVRNILRNYFRCAVVTGLNTTPVPYPPMKTYSIYRIPMLIDGTTKWTLNQYKAKIDECVANNGWLIWTTESENEEFDSTLQGYIEDLIDYARGLNVEIVNIENGIDIIGNVIDIGDPGDDSYFNLGCDGNFNTNAICVDDTKYSFYDALTTFPKDKVTVAWIGSTKTTGFPHADQGLLTTYRLGGNTIDRQEFRPKNFNEIWARYADSNGKWGYFMPLTLLSGTTSNRPYDNYIGYSYFDTTLNKPVWVKTAGAHEVDTLTITEGATVSGNITITTSLGVDVVVAVTEDMTIAEVDAAIREATFTGFKIGGVAGSGVIVFTDLITQSGIAAVFDDTGGTGVTGTFVRTVTGVSTVWVDYDTIYIDNDKYNYYDDITAFPENQVTVAWIGDSNKTGFPHGDQGLLTTYRLGGIGIDRQEFRPKGFNEIWVRYVGVNNEWDYFTPLTQISGETADRPYDNYVGCPFYDITLNKPIWVKTAGVHEVDTLTITAGATSSGDITITTSLGADVVITVTAEMTIAEVDEAIRAATFTGFNVSGVAGSGVIVFTDLIAQGGTAPVFADTGITGVTGEFVRTAVGVNTVWVDGVGADLI